MQITNRLNFNRDSQRPRKIRQEIRNSCGVKIPDSEIEQYKNSFFVRTVADWNLLEDTVVTADSVTAFSSAVGRVLQGAATPPPPHIGN